MSNELIPIETITSTGIEESKALKIKATFDPMVKMLLSFEDKYNEIIEESKSGITKELSAKAKRLRLDVGKVRIETGKIKDEQKKYIKLEDKAIMGAHNILIYAVVDKEDRLKEIEKHQEKLEQERLKKLQHERVEILSQYVEDAHERDLSGMDDDVWEAVLNAKKKAYEDRIEAEKKAEADRIEKERLDKIENERHLKILPYRQFWDCDSYDLRTIGDDVFDKLLVDLHNCKIEHDKEQEKIRVENERLKKEREEREREERERVAEIERKKREKIESDRKAKEEAEKKKREDEAAETARKHYAALKKEAEEKERIRREAKERADKLQAELKAKETAEKKRIADEKARIQSEKDAEEARMQAELSKGDADKISDLINDLNSLKTKYSFKSKKNKTMYGSVKILIDKIVNHINS